MNANSSSLGPNFSGKVWLVGAGPGDPDLLTLRAARLVMQAELIVHDGLVDPRILAMAPGSAQLVSVAKRRSRHSMPQDEINALLVAEALAGRQVVRLKGGDPFIFGRGGEEAEACHAAGVAVEVVPGISAGLGGTAAAGIPITHRGLARSVAFATGHDSSGALADIDWASLARGAEVLVLYMAQRQIGAIADRLIAAGRAPEEPVALVANATGPNQSVVVTTLANAGRDAAVAAAPLSIVIGPVVALRQLLAQWQQTEPMKTLRVTVRNA